MQREHRPHHRDLDRDLSDPFSEQSDDPFFAGTLGHDEVLQEFFFFYSGPWHVVALQESGEYIDNDAAQPVHRNFALLWNRYTFQEDITSVPLVFVCWKGHTEWAVECGVAIVANLVMVAPRSAP